MFQIEGEPAVQIFVEGMQSARQPSHVIEGCCDTQIIQALANTLRVVRAIRGDKPLGIVKIPGIAVVEEENVHASADIVNLVG